MEYIMIFFVIFNFSFYFAVKGLSHQVKSFLKYYGWKSIPEEPLVALEFYCFVLKF
jgi:hypothetical protein